MFAGCSPARPAAVIGPASGDGWAIRYNAVLALAHRGAPQFTQPETLDLMAELLNEDQQLRNFRTKLDSGREVSNPNDARDAIVGGLHAVATYHEKRPTADLSTLKPAIEKLTTSQNKVIAKEARIVLDSLTPSKTS